MDMGTHIETIILILSAVERLNGFKKLNIKDIGKALIKLLSVTMLSRSKINAIQFQYFQDVEDGSFLRKT